MYADYLVLIATSSNGLRKCMTALEKYCKRQLTINVNKTIILIINKRLTNDKTYNICGQNIEIVKSFVYLGIEISSTSSSSSSIYSQHASEIYNIYNTIYK